MNPQVEKMLRERSRVLQPNTKCVMERYWNTEAMAEIFIIYKDGYKLMETGSREEMHAVMGSNEMIASLLETAKDKGVEQDADLFEWQKNRDPELRSRMETGEVEVPSAQTEEVVEETPAEEVPQDPVQ